MIRKIQMSIIPPATKKEKAKVGFAQSVFGIYEKMLGFFCNGFCHKICTIKNILFCIIHSLLVKLHNKREYFGSDHMPKNTLFLVNSTKNV